MYVDFKCSIVSLCIFVAAPNFYATVVTKTDILIDPQLIRTSDERCSETRVLALVPVAI